MGPPPRATNDCVKADVRECPSSTDRLPAESSAMLTGAAMRNRTRNHARRASPRLAEKPFLMKGTRNTCSVDVPSSSESVVWPS